MANPNTERSRIDSIKNVVSARRRFDQSVREAAERIADDYSQGRTASACMAQLVEALGKGRPPSLQTASVVTAEMMHDLHVLQLSKPMGCFRSTGKFASPFGSITEMRAAQLTAPKLARLDYGHRTPRLQITKLGAALLNKQR